MACSPIRIQVAVFLVVRHRHGIESGRLILPGENCNCLFRRKYCLQCKHEHLVDGGFNEHRCSSKRFLRPVLRPVEDEDLGDGDDALEEGEDDRDVAATDGDKDDAAAAAAPISTNENEMDDASAVEEDEREEETAVHASASSNAAHLSQQQGTEIKRVDYHELMRYSKDLCEAVANTQNSVGAAAVILQLTRLAHGGTMAEGTLHEIVSSTANAFGTQRKRRKVASTVTAIGAAPLVGRVVHPGRPAQHCKRAASEGPPPRKKKDPSCGFCGAMVCIGDHSKVTNCSQIRKIGTLLKRDGSTGYSAKKVLLQVYWMGLLHVSRYRWESA
jgi:hypothetical protein